MSPRRRARGVGARRAFLPPWLPCAVLAALLVPQGAAAERIGSLKVPESVADLPRQERFPPLLDPPPLNGSWAVVDHRPLGVHLDNYDLTQAQIEAAQHTGCRLVRLNVPMEHFLEEAEPDWAVLDQVISRLRRADFEVLPVLTARAAIPEFYQQFCTAVASRYAETFDSYQLLDNINYKIGLQTRDYADLVSVARAAILVADPGATIISGGIRGADLTYLEMLAQQGALRSLDVLAFNLYPPADGIERLGSGALSEHCLPYMEQVTDWAAGQGKRVWITSFGVSTSLNWVGVDQVTQASIYARGSLYLGWLGAERIIFASIQDTDPAYQIPAQCCGLLDVTGSPKASYYALQALNHSIEGAYHVAPPCIYQGYTYERPEAADLLIAAELQNDPDADALAEFQVYNLSVYAFWFYVPAAEQYRMVYWVGSETLYPALLTLHVGHIGLTPRERYALLDNAPSPVAYQFAQNFLYLPYQPMGQVPGVISFEVNENGRPG